VPRKSSLKTSYVTPHRNIVPALVPAVAPRGSSWIGGNGAPHWRSAGQGERSKQESHRRRDCDRVEPGPAHDAEATAWARAEAAGIHRQCETIAVADGEDEQSDQKPWVPRRAQATDPARLPKGREILAEARQGLVCGKRAVGEAIR